MVAAKSVQSQCRLLIARLVTVIKTLPNRMAKMNGLPYYPRYPRDFFDGTNGMSFELKGAYSIILDLIYMSGGKLHDEPRFIAGHMNCSVRAWNGYRAALIDMGKISAEGGIISNFRADKELIIQRSFQNKQRENASAPRKNNGLGEAVAKPKPSHADTDTDTEEGLGKPNPVQSDHSQACFDHFNAAAGRVGWSKVQKFDPARKAALSRRIRDVGGVAAWMAAIDRAALSPLLTGQSGRGWVADFDWLCKAANFTKLMEGNYDPRTSNDSAGKPRRAGDGSATVDAFREIAARYGSGPQ